jgi:hypothetical protein
MLKLKAQPIKLGKDMFTLWSQAPPVAAEGWVKALPKPRNELRKKEKPLEDVSLESLQKKGLVEIQKCIEVKGPRDLEKVPGNVDFFVVNADESLFTQDSILEKLISLGKPILAKWDNWGFSWTGRYSKLRLRKYSEAKYYRPFGIDDLKEIFNAIRAWKRIRTMHILYIDQTPSHSIVSSDKTSDLDYLKKRFGTDFVHLNISDYMKAVESVGDGDAKEFVKKWKDAYTILDKRDRKLLFYSKIYIGLKRLLKKICADAVTIDCACIPDIEYVPCFAFSKLIDEGVPSACEGDIPTLYMMTAMMEISKGSAMMGNLNENATHGDIENNIITINHDVIPPSLGCGRCKLKLRDYHGTGKGLTPYINLGKNIPVTLGGMHWDMDKIWTAKGAIQWSKDVRYCRIAVGIRVENAKRIAKNAFGHHIVMVYGDYVRDLKRLAELLGVEHVAL